MKPFEFKVKAKDIEGIVPGVLADGMPNLAGMGVKLDDVKTALTAIDQESLKTKSLQRIKVKIWGDGDLVGGVDLKKHPNAEMRAQMMGNVDRGGSIYLIYVDNKLTYNQWHIPGEGLMPVTNDRLQGVVDEHVKEIAQSLFNSAVRQEVLKKL